MACERPLGLYAPIYFTDFKCTADKCTHSCCIDWEICIDGETLKKYKSIKSIADTVVECDAEFCFKLQDGGRCPHLNDSGLCDIIISYGEEYLSDICRNHPRFFNDVGCGVREAGLGIVCEEACRIILEDKRPFSLVRIGDSSGEETDFSPLSEDFSPIEERDRVIRALEACGKSLDEKLAELKKHYSIPEIHTEDEWIDFYLDLEILDTGWRETLLSLKSKEGSADSYSPSCFDGYFENLLKYFVYRHLATAESYDALRARLGFAILSAETVRSIFECEKEKTKENLFDLVRRYSSEIEYSEDNTAELIFEFESEI